MILVGLHNEFLKIIWRRKYQVLLVLCAVFCVAYGVLSAGAITISGITLSLSSIVYSVLSPMTSLILPLVIFMLTTDLYTHELENKSIECVVTRPVSRFSVYLSKFLAIACYVALLLGVTYVITGVFQVVSDGPGSLWGAFVSYLVSILPLLGFIATSALLAVLIPNPTMAMFLSIITYVVMLVAGLIWDNVGVMLFTSYLGWYKMWVGSGVPFGRIAVTASLILSHVIIFFTCGFLLFDKKDI